MKEERSADGRILLTQEVRNGLHEKLIENGCEPEKLMGKFNFDPPTTTEYFESQDLAFSAELPMNPLWGTPTYAPRPYEVLLQDPREDSSLSFGPVGVMEGCGLMRLYELSIDSQKSIGEITEEITKQNGEMFLGGDVPEQAKPQTVTIGEYDAVRFTEDGFCTTPTIIVPGPLYSYRIFALCSGGSEEEFDVLSDIVESMKFLDVRSIQTSDDECDKGPDPLPAIETVHHEDWESFAIDFPFNPNWKDWEGEQVMDGEKTNAGLVFGPLRYTYSPNDAPRWSTSPCSPVRDFQFFIGMPVTQEEVVTEYKERFPEMAEQIKAQRIGSVDTVVIPAPEAVCPTPEIIVIAKESTWHFTMSCEGIKHYDDPLGELTKIVKTMRLK